MENIRSTAGVDMGGKEARLRAGASDGETPEPTDFEYRSQARAAAMRSEKLKSSLYSGDADPPPPRPSYFRPYIGTKQIHAEPAVRDGKYGYRVIYEDGYESWSPKDVFEAAYQQPNVGMNFGHALEMLKHNYMVCREGWNGKGMYIYLVGPGRYAPTTYPGHAIAAFEHDGKVPYHPYIAMKTVTGEVVPWVVSQTDMLADDWRIA